MASRLIRIKPSARVAKCPKCGNNTHFFLKAERCREDLCETRVETWIECKCGYDPTISTKDRCENVLGETDKATAATAVVSCWNDSIKLIEEFGDDMEEELGYREDCSNYSRYGH